MDYRETQTCMSFSVADLLDPTMKHSSSRPAVINSSKPVCRQNSWYSLFFYGDRQKAHSHAKIDCSHGNSSKQHKRQMVVADDIVCPRLQFYTAASHFVPQARQLESPESETAQMIMGVMIESNLVEGRQDVPPSGPAGLKYGQSVTDGTYPFSP